MSAPTDMAALAGAAAGMDLETFRLRHGQAFLLFTGQQAELRPAAREWQATLGHHGRKVGGAAPQRLRSMLVFPLHSTSEPWTVMVGRVPPNDVVIPDESVSVQHAVFRRGRRDRIFLQDSGSKNGTYINESRVPEKPRGAMEVRTSNMVRFGSVVMTFLLPAEILDLARTLAAVTATHAQRPATPQPGTLDAGELFGDVAAPGATGQVPIPGGLLTYFDAVQYVQTKRYRSAEILLKDILRRDPQNRNAKIWLLLAQARQHARAGDAASAAARYREVLGLDPAHDEAVRALRRLDP